MKRTLFYGLCFSLLFGSLSCKRSATDQNSNEKALVFARPGDSVGFDLAKQEDGESINIGANFFEPLVRFKLGTTEIEPALATSWTISPDGLSYTFDIRQNVKFHDGTSLDADAVVFSVERQFKKDHPAYRSGAPYKYWDAMSMNDILESVKKTGGYQVEFKLKKPNAPFLANLAMPFMSIVSPAAVLKYQNDFDTHPVGTGPYTLKSWKKDHAMELEAFSEYWGESPHIKRVIVRVIPDNQVRLLELRKGSIHIMEYPNPSDIQTVKTDPNVELLTQEGLNIGYLAFNTKKAPFDKMEVRKALSMAIDRKRIIEEIYLGFGTVANNPIPPFVLGYNPHVEYPSYNPEMAKALLTQAGIKGLQLELWAMPVARPYNPNARKMAEFMQADFRRVGVEAKIVSYDWGTYLDKIGNGEHELLLIGWTGDNGDPDNFLYTLWSKDSALAKPTQNYSFYRSDIATSKMKLAQTTAAPQRRAKIYREVLDQMAKDIPVLPIAHSVVVVPIRKEVEGYVINPTGTRWFASVSFKSTP